MRCWPPSRRARRLARNLAAGAAAALAAHVLFAAATLLASGHLPEWGAYVDMVRTFTVQGYGALPIAAWSPSLLLAAGYVLSATAVVVALRRSTPARSVPAYTA